MGKIFGKILFRTKKMAGIKGKSGIYTRTKEMQTGKNPNSHKGSLGKRWKIKDTSKMKGQNGFKKGHLPYQGIEKGQFKKGIIPKTAFKKGHNFDKETVKRILRRRGKSSLEIKFENIINNLGLPYKFVGNGEIMVARKVPDFVNSNRKKIAIEVFYRKHKEKFRNGLEEWKADRIRIFTENGWKIIFFDETQVNEENVKNILGS